MMPTKWRLTPVAGVPIPLFGGVASGGNGRLACGGFLWAVGKTVREGFEPTRPLRVCTISSRVPSTARPPHLQPVSRRLSLFARAGVRPGPTEKMARIGRGREEKTSAARKVRPRQSSVRFGGGGIDEWLHPCSRCHRPRDAETAWLASIASTSIFSFEATRRP